MVIDSETSPEHNTPCIIRRGVGGREGDKRGKVSERDGGGEGEGGGTYQ